MQGRSEPFGILAARIYRLKRLSTDAGTEMDRSDSQLRKADLPMLAILEPGSTATSESLWQPSKQRLEIVSIDEGMQIV
jgi:hypothetical protein